MANHVTAEGGLVNVARRSGAGEELLLDLGEWANDFDWLLAGAEDRPRREAHGRVLGVVAGLREELRLLETIDQAADIRPIEHTGAHGTGLAGRDQRAGPQEIRRIGRRGAPAELGLGVTQRVDIALAHEDAVVGPDQDGAEGVLCAAASRAASTAARRWASI
jgi:hypothetical protein